MTSSLDRNQWLAIGLLVIIVAAMRLLPHPDNVTPIGALGLFAGAVLPTRAAWLLPVAALLIGDAFTGFYELPAMALVYLGFAGSAVIGRVLLARSRTVSRVAGSALCSALFFFVVSNFAAWLLYYPPTWAGLVECYVAAIPYFGHSLFGDALYTALLFSAWAFFQRYHAAASREAPAR
ncbi:MAG: DUF6580 family putative transport protein [Pseudohongiellaceae bacterium]